MTRCPRLQNKLHKMHLLEAAESVVLDDNLVSILWTLRQGERLDLNAASITSGPVQKYRLEYVVTRGPTPGHWAYRPFAPMELTLMFTAKHCGDIAHAWTLFDE